MTRKSYPREARAAGCAWTLAVGLLLLACALIAWVFVTNRWV